MIWRCVILHRDIVLLRAEQNIPDSFNTHKFKPIQADTSDSCQHTQQADSDRNGGDKEADVTADMYSSSGDIVLTLRSVQV